MESKGAYQVRSRGTPGFEFKSMSIKEMSLKAFSYKSIIGYLEKCGQIFQKIISI